LTLALQLLGRFWPYLVAAICVLVVWAALSAGQRDRATANQAKAAATVSRAGDAASAAAATATGEFMDRKADRDNMTRENRDAILSTPDAGANAGAAGDAGLGVLCRRPEYKRHPRCA
jgi:hypothetical protein